MSESLIFAKCGHFSFLSGATVSAFSAILTMSEDRKEELEVSTLRDALRRDWLVDGKKDEEFFDLYEAFAYNM